MEDQDQQIPSSFSKGNLDDKSQKDLDVDQTATPVEESFK